MPREVFSGVDDSHLKSEALLQDELLSEINSESSGCVQSSLPATAGDSSTAGAHSDSGMGPSMSDGELCDMDKVFENNLNSLQFHCSPQFVDYDGNVIEKSLDDVALFPDVSELNK